MCKHKNPDHLMIMYMDNNNNINYKVMPGIHDHDINPNGFHRSSNPISSLDLYQIALHMTLNCVDLTTFNIDHT